MPAGKRTKVKEPPKDQAGKSVKKEPAKKNGTAANNGSATAEMLAKQQREISVSEFFAKNRHLLGFDNPTRALLTSVKEAVDNALDACEEAGILPEVEVIINQINENRFCVIVEDNGPGIVKEQVPKVFGKLLYGSKFHRLKMNRGQQGIGISAVCLYSQLTTGKPFKVISKIEGHKKAFYCELMIETSKNEPRVIKSADIDVKNRSGVRIEFEVEGRYIKGDKSVDEYLRLTSLANPHVTIRYTNPAKEKITFKRITKEIFEVPREIKPHPYGVELGNLVKILQGAKHRNIKGLLTHEFSRVSDKVATEILNTANIKPSAQPDKLELSEVERLFDAIHKTKIMAPPTNCVAPIGEEKLKRAMEHFAKGEFITATTRQPSVYRGNPFLVEAAVNYMIPDYPQDQQIKVFRLANRVPLLYQPGACAVTEAVQEVDWRGYGVTQSGGQIPCGPMAVLVHIASVWVPFTSEAKEAIAHYPEIIKEIKLALQECGRQLSVFINKRRKAMYQAERRSMFERYIPEVASSLHGLAGANEDKTARKLQAMSKKITISADEIDGSVMKQIEKKARRESDVDSTQ